MFLDDTDLQAYEKSKELSLQDKMPMGKCKGVSIEDYINSNPYSLKWFVDEGIVTLDGASHKLLNTELDERDSNKFYLDDVTDDGDLPF